jgi:hypothetical protein
VGLGFLISKLLWSRLGFPVYIILLRFGDIVSMHGYLHVFTYSLYVHSMPKFENALYAHQIELRLLLKMNDNCWCAINNSNLD